MIKLVNNRIKYSTGTSARFETTPRMSYSK